MSTAKGRSALGLCLLLGASACEKVRDPELREACPTWLGSVRTEIETRCTACHPNFSSYSAFTDDEIAIAGDSASSMLAVLSPTATITGHRAPADTRALFSKWVVECRLRYTPTPIHDDGLLDPRATDFHANSWRETNYSQTACRDCHGSLNSMRGDAPGCERCHAGGEEACSTCHARIESNGAHGLHLRGAALGLRYDCSLCHQVPESLRAAGHVLLADGQLDDGIPEIMLGGAAGPSASFDPNAGTCSQVACHVTRTDDTAARRQVPTWRTPETGPACDRCHGSPPSGHVSDRCLDCHPSAVLPDGTNGPRHLNGGVELGRNGLGTCSDCHGSGPLGAPPPDLMGRVDPRTPTVGAHAAHLTPTRRLGNPTQCGDCHRVPTEISSPGHLDTLSPAEVFPSEIAARSLAFQGGRAPTYSPTLQTCAQVYCHGEAEPNWTKPGLFEVSCGSCHGVPPREAPHTSDMGLSSCNTCHAASIDMFGNFIFQDTPEGKRTVHIDGNVDL